MKFTRKRPEPFFGDAQLADTPEIARIHAQAFARGWSDGEIEGLMQQPGVTTLVVRPVGAAANRLLGFVMARKVLDEAEILTVSVDEKQRGNGFGTSLMREVIRELQAKDAASLFLEVSEQNAAAVRLYKRLGFEIVGERQGYYRSAADSSSDAASTTETAARALVMRLDLL